MATRTMEPVSTKLRPDEKRAFLETCDSIGTSPSNALRMFVSNYKGHRECHLAPGWLLICRVEGDRLTLTAT